MRRRGRAGRLRRTRVVRQVLLDEGLSGSLQGLARSFSMIFGRFLGARRHYLLSTSRSRFPSASQILLFLDSIRMIEMVPC